MKVTINVDCSPEEARRFLGLPDVAPMQEALLQEMQQRMSAGMSAMNPAELMKLWMPLGLEGWQELQKSFWGVMSGRSGDAPPSS